MCPFLQSFKMCEKKIFLLFSYLKKIYSIWSSPHFLIPIIFYLCLSYFLLVSLANGFSILLIIPMNYICLGWPSLLYVSIISDIFFFSFSLFSFIINFPLTFKTGHIMPQRHFLLYPMFCYIL